MCQLNVYVVRNGHEDLVLGDVTLVEVDGDKVFLTTMFEPRQAIGAKIRVVDLVRNRLLLVPTDSKETKKNDGNDGPAEAGHTPRSLD
jgi:predicted RNA-binding protein